MTDTERLIIEALAGGLTAAQREAARSGCWDETPDSVSYECAFGDLHGCYRHPHATGLAVQRLLREQGHG
jgi:hypothetical protein